MKNITNFTILFYNEFLNFWFDLFYAIYFYLLKSNKENVILYSWPMEIKITSFLLDSVEIFVYYNKQIVYYFMLPIFLSFIIIKDLWSNLIFYSYFLEYLTDYYFHLYKRAIQFFVIKNGQEIIFHLEKLRFTFMEMELDDISPCVLEAHGKLKDWDIALLKKREALYDRTPPFSSWTKIWLFKYNKPADGYIYTDSYFPIPWNKIKQKALDYAWENWEKRNYEYWATEKYVKSVATYDQLIFKRRFYKLMNLPAKKPPANSFIIKEIFDELALGYYKDSKFISSYHNSIIEGLLSDNLLPKKYFSIKVSKDLAPEVILTLKLSKVNQIAFDVKTNNDLLFYEFLEKKYGLTRKIKLTDYVNFYDNQVLLYNKEACIKHIHAMLFRCTLFVEVWEKMVNYKPFWEPLRESIELSSGLGYDLDLWKMNRLVPNYENWPILPTNIDKNSYNFEQEWNQNNKFLIELFRLPSNDPFIPLLKKWLNGDQKYIYNFGNGISVDYTDNFYKRLCVVLRDNLLFQNSLHMLGGVGRKSNEDPLGYLFTFQDVLLNWYRLGLISYDRLVETYYDNWQFNNTLEFYKQIQEDIVKYLKINNYDPRDRAKFDIFFSFEIPKTEFTWHNGKCAMIFYREDGAPSYWVWGHEKCKIFVMDYKGGYDIIVSSKKDQQWTSFWLYLRRAFHPSWYPVKNAIAHYSQAKAHPLMPNIYYHGQPYPYFDLFAHQEPIFKVSYSIEKWLTYDKQALDYKIYQKRYAVKLASYIKQIFNL